MMYRYLLSCSDTEKVQCGAHVGRASRLQGSLKLDGGARHEVTQVAAALDAVLHAQETRGQPLQALHGLRKLQGAAAAQERPPHGPVYIRALCQHLQSFQTESESLDRAL